MTTDSEKVSVNDKKIFFTGVIGGITALIFSFTLGPLFSGPMLAGQGGFSFYFVFLIVSPVIAIIGSLIGAKNRTLSSSLLLFAGCMSLWGYGLSPASIFGLLFFYASHVIFRSR